MPIAYRFFEKTIDGLTYVVGNPNHSVMKTKLDEPFKIILAERQMKIHWYSIKRIGLVYSGDELVSIKAIKYHTAAYTKGIFKSAGLSMDTSHIKYELGYSWTKEEFRGRHISSNLSELMLEPDLIDKMYVTTDEKNTPVHKMMDKFGFERIGSPWKGLTGMLVLYTRPKEKE